MKLHLILLSMILCCQWGAKAEELPNALVFEMKDGSNVAFLYDELPLVKFTEKDIVVKTHLNETTYPQTSVQKYVFSYVKLSSVSSSMADAEDVKLADNTLFISNLKSGTEVSLVSIDGMVLSLAYADANGQCVIPLSSFRTGVYLLNYSNVSVKIMKP